MRKRNRTLRIIGHDMDKNLENQCREKERELLDTYFGKLVEEAAHNRPETIEDYTPGLPLKIEAEYRGFLEGLWGRYSEKPLVLEEQKLRRLLTDDDREAIRQAYRDAARITPWEKITGSNHKDVTHYKGLLLEYTRDLLAVMRADFLEELTGRHIKNKAFEE